MSIEIRISLRNTEGALLRTLGTLERRGFSLGAMQCQNEGGRIQMRVQVDPNGRSLDVMLRQLRKLYDVVEAGMDMSPELFVLPLREINVPQPSMSRRAMGFLGIPERVSNPQGRAA